MTSFWRKIGNNYHIFKDRHFNIAFAGSLLLLVGSCIVNYLALLYARDSASNPVTDIVLSNTRAFDVEDIFFYGPLVFWVCVSAFLFSRPKTIPFAIKSVALFILVRSVFISLTHIGPFPIKVPLDSIPSYFQYFSSGADLFFSGHTGLPFLFALMFWESIWLRRIFVVCSIFFGAIVLLGHFHYSIDVLSAFFITYSIYHIALQLFRKDYTFFKSAPESVN